MRRPNRDAYRRRIYEIWAGSNVAPDVKTRKLIGERAEELARDKILPSLGFSSIIRFNDQFVRVRNRHSTPTYRQRSPFAIYCRHGNERWFIEVTTAERRTLDRTWLPVIFDLGARFAVLYVKRDWSSYIFKEEVQHYWSALSLNDIRQARSIPN